MQQPLYNLSLIHICAARYKGLFSVTINRIVNDITVRVLHAIVVDTLDHAQRSLSIFLTHSGIGKTTGICSEACGVSCLLYTSFAMAYIIVVNPQILSQTGMPWGGVFLATIIAAIIGTLVMGLFANVPYAQAAGMGLNAFFTYTVCFGLGFSWQQTMCCLLYTSRCV